MGFVGVSVTSSTVLAAAATLYDRAPTEIRKRINAQTRAARPWVRTLVTFGARSNLDRAMTRTVAVRASQRLSVVMGSTGTLHKTTAGRPAVKKRDLVRQVEFGANRNKLVRYVGRSPKGTKYPIQRHTARQLPYRRPKGRLMYAALPDIAPRLLATYVRSIADYFEGT